MAILKVCRLRKRWNLTLKHSPGVSETPRKKDPGVRWYLRTVNQTVWTHHLHWKERTPVARSFLHKPRYNNASSLHAPTVTPHSAPDITEPCVSSLFAPLQLSLLPPLHCSLLLKHRHTLWSNEMVAPKVFTYVAAQRRSAAVATCAKRAVTTLVDASTREEAPARAIPM